MDSTLSEGQLVALLFGAWAVLLLTWYATNVLIDFVSRAIVRRRCARGPACQGCGRPTPWPVRACDRCPAKLVHRAYGGRGARKEEVR